MAEFAITAELEKIYRVPLPVEVVQNWISDPERNFGIRLEEDFGGEPGHTHIASSKNELDGNRPSLTVTYRP